MRGGWREGRADHRRGLGLGAASAERFAAEGATVVGVDLRGATLEADVSDEASIEAAVAETVSRHGRIDVLYANAGVASVGQVHETSLAEWQRVLDVNLTGVFLTARAVLADMLARGSGSILLQSSISAVSGYRSLAAYSAAKGGVVALARQMAADYSERGVRVNAITPGTVVTALVEAVYTERAGSAEAGAAGARGARPPGADAPPGRGRGRRQPRAVPRVRRVQVDHRRGLSGRRRRHRRVLLALVNRSNTW